MYLILPDVIRPEAVWGATEIPCKVFYSVDVAANGVGRVVPALEFLQHHLAETGHVDLLVTLTLSRPQNYREAHAVASAAQRLSANELISYLCVLDVPIGLGQYRPYFISKLVNLVKKCHQL
jgi:hypothetical protein